MKVLVHKFSLGDVEDPEIYAAEPILAFERTELGQWLVENSYKQMTYDIVADPSTFAYKVVIHAWLRERDLTFYKLKWS